MCSRRTTRSNTSPLTIAIGEAFKMSRLTMILLLVSVGCHAASSKSTSTARSQASATTPASSTAASSEPLVRSAVAGPFMTVTRTGTVAEFKPAVPAVDSGGRCEAVPDHPMQQAGQRPLLYTFGPRGRAVRNIMVILDSTGAPTRYSDLRGDLRGDPDPVRAAQLSLGTRTSITIDLSKKTGVIRNAGAGLDTVAIRVRGPEMMVAPNLGTPATMIARIIEQCASARR